MTTCGNHTSFQRSISEPPARHSHAEIERTMLTFGVGLGIDAVEHKKLANVGEPTARRSRAEIESTMLTFGVGLDIDAEECQRRTSVDKPLARHSHAEIERTMLTFGVGLDIDAMERQRRKNIGKPEARHSHTEIEGKMLASGVGLDIDAAEHQRQKIVGNRQQPNGQVLPDVDVSHGWDLPLDSSRKVVKAERRPFWEQTHWAEQWALLMDRPRRGNRNSSWKPEVQPKAQTWDDLPDDFQARLCEVKCDLDLALVKKHGKTKAQRPSSQTATKSSKVLPVPTISDVLFDAPWRESFEKSVKAGKLPGSSNASTASGDEMDDGGEIESSSRRASYSTIESSSRRASYSTLDTADSRATDSENGNSVFHFANNPKGKHALLQKAKGDREASSCQSWAIPLGLRRVMCAVLPSDPEASVQLSGNQMRKLKALHGELQAQKRSGANKAPQKRAGVV